MKKLIVCLLVAGLVLFFGVCRIVEKEIASNRAIEEYFLLGYENASLDYLKGSEYYSTMTSEYENLLVQYKLAYDAGYGFGWRDTETGMPEYSERGYEYSWRSPDWMYKIYYLFK